MIQDAESATPIGDTGAPVPPIISIQKRVFSSYEMLYTAASVDNLEAGDERFYRSLTMMGVVLVTTRWDPFQASI